MDPRSVRFDAAMLDELRAKREEFLSDPANTSLSFLRPEVARSWARSQACNVNPDRPTLQVAEPFLDSTLRKASNDVLTDLAETVQEYDGAVSLTDQYGALSWFGGSPRMVDGTEQSMLMPGTLVTEEFVGTNTDGITLEEGTWSQLWGPEHFSSLLTGYFCTSVPVFDPYRSSLRGIVSVMIPDKLILNSDPRSVLLLTQSAASQIRHRLLTLLRPSESEVHTEFIRVSRKRGSHMVVAFDGRNTVANDQAIWELDRSDYGVLAGYAHRAEKSRDAERQPLRLSRGVLVDVTITPVLADSTRAGTVLELRPIAHSAGVSTIGRQGSSDVKHTNTFEGLVGDSSAIREAIDSASAARAPGILPLVTGLPGVGTSTFAEKIAANQDKTPLVLDAREAAEIEQLVSGQESLFLDSTVIVEQAHVLDRGLLAPLIERFQSTSSLDLIFVSNTFTPELEAATAPYDTLEVHVPTLRERREDIPALVHEAIRRYGQEHRPSVKLIEILVRGDWPGNVRQLFSLIRRMVERSTTTDIDVDSLPSIEQRRFSASRLSRLEELELEQIRAALEEAGGNRSKAAALLEIGRSTMYRKMDRYSSKGFEFNF